MIPVFSLLFPFFIGWIYVRYRIFFYLLTIFPAHFPPYISPWYFLWGVCEFFTFFIYIYICVCLEFLDAQMFPCNMGIPSFFTFFIFLWALAKCLFIPSISFSLCSHVSHTYFFYEIIYFLWIFTFSSDPSIVMFHFAYDVVVTFL